MIPIESLEGITPIPTVTPQIINGVPSICLPLDALKDCVSMSLNYQSMCLAAVVGIIVGFLIGITYMKYRGKKE